jgi:hypothetical protein
MAPMNTTKVAKHTASEPLGALVLAGLTVASWFAWMGWDTEYQVDPVTQSSSGPYEPWQVIGCVVTLLVLAVVAALRLSPWTVIATTTVAWVFSAARSDDSGLWAVGAILVAIGMAGGSAITAFAARAVHESRRA